MTMPHGDEDCHWCDDCNKWKAQAKEYLDWLEDCWYQFGSYTNAAGKTFQSNMGLTTLEAIERILKKEGKLK